MILSPRTSPRLLDDPSKLDRLRSRNVCRLEAVRDRADALAGFPLGANVGSVLPQPDAVSGGGGNRLAEPDAVAGGGSIPERGGLLGALAPPFIDGTSHARIAGVILLLLVVPPLVLLTIAAMPRAVLLGGRTQALVRRRDDLLLLGLLWVFVWALYVVLTQGLSLAI